MSYGKLTVVMGPMFAGKTSTLIAEAEKIDAVIFKPRFDTRFSDTDVVSHDGETKSAYTFSSLKDVAEVGELERPYCFDEVQFLDGDRYDGDFIEDVQTLLRFGKEIIVAGLDMDYTGKPFPIMARLAAMADEVMKIGSTCSVCGCFATKTHKRCGGNGAVELGADDMYEPRCNHHWQPVTQP